MAYPTTHLPEAADQSVTDLSGEPCARLTPPGEVARRLAVIDERYIRDNFVPLDELASDWPVAPPGPRRHRRAALAATRVPPRRRHRHGAARLPGSRCRRRLGRRPASVVRARLHRGCAAVRTCRTTPRPSRTNGRTTSAAATSSACARPLRGRSSRRRTTSPNSTSAADPHPGDQVWRKRLRLSVDGTRGDRAAVRDPRPRPVGYADVRSVVRHVPAHAVRAERSPTSDGHPPNQRLRAIRGSGDRRWSRRASPRAGTPRPRTHAARGSGARRTRTRQEEASALDFIFARAGMVAAMTAPIRIGNCSGFYGDRLARRPRDARRRPDRRPDRRLPGRADHADPRRDRAKDPAARLRADVPEPDGGRAWAWRSSAASRS